jgi:hypothetical protein
MVSTFHVEKFSKVRRLMEQSASEGERAAAKSRAEELARKAGLSLAEALQQDDAWQKQSHNPWADDKYWRGFWDSVQAAARKEEEQKRQAEAERMAAYWAEEARKEKARFEEAELKYGPANEAFAETERERLLRQTLEPIAIRKKYSNSQETYIGGFGDWTCRHPSAAVTAILNEAYPLPTDLPGAWREFFEWKSLFERRHAYVRDIDEPVHVRCRKAALESILDNMPVRHWGDFDLRMQWQRIQVDRWHSDGEKLQFLDRLEADIEILRELDTLRDLQKKNVSQSIRRKRRHYASPPEQGDLFAL